MAKQHGSRRNKSDRKSTGKRGNKLERKSSGKRQKEDKYKLRRRNEIDGDVVLNVLAKQDVAMSLTELITALGNRSSDSKNIRTVLQELTELGMILQPRPGRYALNGSGGEYIAKITVDQDANKFANFADGSSAPIAQNHDMGVSDGDVVHILLNEKAEALVIRIVERIGQPMVGTLNFQTREVSFTPDNRRKGDLPIVGKKKQIIDSYQSGDRVVGELVQTPTGSFAVELKRILDEQSPEIADFERVRLIHDLPEPFEEHIESAAKAQVISDFTVGDRMDCREDFIFTIDPETAKDFDDAISISRGERGIWKLGVHIADVSHFVEEHGMID